MRDLQALVEGYLSSAGYMILETHTGFVVADRLTFGGDHDTRLLWITPPTTEERNFSQTMERLPREFELKIPQYSNGTGTVVAHSRAGFTSEFLAEAIRFGVRLRVPIEFFDAPYRIEAEEESTEARRLARLAASAIEPLRDLDSLRKRARQPYNSLVNGEWEGQGDDLLVHLFNELKSPPSEPVLRIVVGPAGAGKSVFFQALFALLYDHFLGEKRKREVFPRPVPLLPDHLRKASGLRLEAIIDSFVHTEVAAPIPPDTFCWMLVHGFSTWLLDGLDELYAGDAEFFDKLLDLMTQPESKSEILICARDSLLTTCESFARFLDESRAESAIRVYKLSAWGQPSKRDYAWIRSTGHLPDDRQPDPSEVSEFLRAVGQSESLRSLSSLPYYCQLLWEEFKNRTMEDFTNDLALIDHAVSSIIQREEHEKKTLRRELFQPGGVEYWLETMGWVFYTGNYKGILKNDVEEYAQLVLREGLSEEEKRSALMTLLQFPLFVPGPIPGIVIFKHELIADSLAGRYLLREVSKGPRWVGHSLGARIDLADSLIARYVASRLTGEQESLRVVIQALKEKLIVGRAFANLLQILLMSSPTRDVIRVNGIELDNSDLRYVRFVNKDLCGVSFRNCELSDTAFSACDLQNASFEGACLSGTRFERLAEGALCEAGFGNLERFECIYVGKERIDDHKKMRSWVQKMTGVTQEIEEPCPAALQLRILFLKYVRPNGDPRRHELLESALGRGVRLPNAPSPEDCMRAGVRFGYLEEREFRKRIKRASGDLYGDIVSFIKDGTLTSGMRHLLNSLCPTTGCLHMPGTR